jgi:lipoyl(octanoyl) transferase
MEFDRVLGEESPPDMPFLRLYTWDAPTISIGCNQNPARRLDLDLCRQENIPVVRRPTGGRELLHGHDLCYSAAIPLDKPIGGVRARGVFTVISDLLVAALRGMGIDARWAAFSDRPRLGDGPCFIQADSGEITVSGRKLIASAQRVYPRCILQQGSMPLFRPNVDLARYLRYGNRDELRRRIGRTTAYLHEISPETKEIGFLVEHFRGAFEAAYASPAGLASQIFDSFSRNNHEA